MYGSRLLFLNKSLERRGPRQCTKNDDDDPTFDRFQGVSEREGGCLFSQVLVADWDYCLNSRSRLFSEEPLVAHKRL